MCGRTCVFASPTLLMFELLHTRILYIGTNTELSRYPSTLEEYDLRLRHSQLHLALY